MDVFDLLRCAVSLAAVFGALWFLHRRLTKGPRGKGLLGQRARVRSIDVVARHGLGAKAGVAVVDVEGRRYLIGVTEHQVNVLDRLGPAPADAPEPVVLPASAMFERELEAAERGETDRSGPLQPEPPTRIVERFAERPAVTTVTAAVVVQQTTSAGTETVAILPAQPFPTRRAARAAAQGIAPSSRSATAAAESPQDEFERMLQAVIEGRTPPPATPEPIRIPPSRTPEPARAASPLAGSILSADTWRQTVAAIRRLR